MCHVLSRGGSRSSFGSFFSEFTFLSAHFSFCNHIGELFFNRFYAGHYFVSKVHTGGKQIGCERFDIQFATR